jgi:hypothetical protein
VRLGPEHIQSASGWSLYEGTEFKGWPVATVLGGRLAAEWSGDACTIADDVRGRFIARDPASVPSGGYPVA